jgi:hypothetical protein
LLGVSIAQTVAHGGVALRPRIVERVVAADGRTLFQAVLFVSHNKLQVTVIERTATGWTQREFRSGDIVELAEPKLSFPVDELYAGIALETT